MYSWRNKGAYVGPEVPAGGLIGCVKAAQVTSAYGILFFYWCLFVVHLLHLSRALLPATEIGERSSGVEFSPIFNRNQMWTSRLWERTDTDTHPSRPYTHTHTHTPSHPNPPTSRPLLPSSVRNAACATLPHIDGGLLQGWTVLCCCCPCWLWPQQWPPRPQVRAHTPFLPKYLQAGRGETLLIGPRLIYAPQIINQ